MSVIGADGPPSLLRSFNRASSLSLPRVGIGRVGEPLHEFDFTATIRADVAKSGLFPELFTKPWPKMASGILASSRIRKHAEHMHVLSPWDFPIIMPASFWNQPTEQSKETEQSAADIAAGKCIKSIVQPFRQCWPSINKDEVAELTARAQTDNLAHTVVISDDRDSVQDPSLRYHTHYQGLHHHSSELVREMMDSAHDFPGKRVNELVSAEHGVLNLVLRRNKIINEMQSAHMDVCEYHTMRTTLCFFPLLQAGLPLPEQGLVISAPGKKVLFRSVTDQDRMAMQQGKIFSFDDFELVPAEYGLPPGTTVADLKEKDPNHTYLVHAKSYAIAMRAFASIAGLPRSGESGLRPSFKPVQSPRTIVASSQIGVCPPDRNALSFKAPPGMEIAQTHDNAGTLEGLYNAVKVGQAFVIESPDNIPEPGESSYSHEDLRVLRALEANLMFSYLAVLTTVTAATNHIGRVNAVHQNFIDRYGQWYADFCNLGLTGDARREAFLPYRTQAKLNNLMDQWDRSTFRDTAGLFNGFHLLKEEDVVRAVMGRAAKDMGYVAASYGSASSLIHEAYQDAYDITYELARYGLTNVHGGGTASSMLGMQEGPLKAYREGYKFKNLGIRSEDDVSLLEGHVTDWVRDNGFDVTPGELPEHFHYADGQMHILNMKRLLQRQAMIAAISNVGVFVAGGKGTVLEAFILMMHNFHVQTRGEGIFPGFKSNTKVIPLAFSNHEFSHLGLQRGIFDMLLEPWREHAALLGIHDFKGKDRVRDLTAFVIDHGRSLGHSLDLQTPGAALVHPVPGLDKAIPA